MRKTLSVLLGVLAAIIVIYAIELINHALYPMPAHTNPHDMHAIQAWIKTLPAAAYIVVICAYFFGSAVGGATAKWISQSSSVPAIVVGCIILLSGIANFIMIRPPVWFAIICLLIYVPAAWLGAQLVEHYQRRAIKHTAR